MDEMPLALDASGCDAVELVPVNVVVGIVPGAGNDNGVNPGGYTPRVLFIPEGALVVVAGGVSPGG